LHAAYAARLEPGSIIHHTMKMLFILSALSSITFGVTAQLSVKTNTLPDISFYAPSFGQTQRVVEIRRAEFRALLSTNTPVRLAPSGGLPELHRMPWQEPRRGLHLLDIRIQPFAPEATQ
jgi:hypothetical protein